MSRRRSGFTLIELLVVVAIIALLISILLPSLSRARETARMVKCLAVQKQYGMASIMYAEGNDNWYVPFSSNGQYSQKFCQGGGFWGAYIPFRQNLGLRTSGGSNNNPGEGQNSTPDLVCPSKANPEYIQKGWWHRIWSFNGQGQGVWGNNKSVNRARVRNPAMKGHGYDAVNWKVNNSGQMNPVPNWDVKGDTDDINTVHAAYRHMEQLTILFHDGHASNFHKDDAYKAQHSYRISLYDPYKN